MKDRTLLTTSAVVLAVALVVSAFILVKAWKNLSPPAELAIERARLNAVMDEVQAELAANEALLRVRSVAAAHAAPAGLEEALTAAARGARDALARTDDVRFPVQFAAVAFHVTAPSGGTWLASPLGTEDAEWLRATVGRVADRADASAFELQATRSRGLAIATFDVAGVEHRGGIYWMLGRRASPTAPSRSSRR